MAAKKAKKAAKTAAKTARKVSAGKPAGAAKKAGRARKAPAKRRAAPAKRARASKSATKHPIVHWEIQSQKPEELHTFYREAFGWTIDANNPMKYGMVSSRGRDGINGGIGGSGEAPGSRVLVYASVPSIERTLATIESLGGKTLMPRTDLGMVVMALYADPEGNTMGLVEG